MSSSVRNEQTDDESNFNQDTLVPFEPVIRPPLRSIDKFAEPRIPHLSHRYTVAFMMFLGLFVIFGTRCNVGMTKIHLDIWRSIDEPKLNWDIANDINTLSFWSFLFSQIPGGLLAYKFPANKVFGIGVLCSAVFNIILPWISGYERIFAIFYVLQGFAQGIIFPAVYGILRFWAPPLERSRLAAITISGVFAGMLLGVPICGFLLYFLHSRLMFIIFGILGLIWYGFWYWLVFEKPRAHPAISEEELMYIEKSLEEPTTMTTLNIPWVKIVTSLPVYAVSFAHFSQMWSCFFILYYKNKFLRHKFAFRAHGGGLISILPYLELIAFILLGGFLADYLRSATATNIRKIFTCFGFVFQAACFFLMSRATTAAGTLVLILLMIAFSGFAVSGYIINILDIAPRFGSILLGLVNTAGLLAGLICPILVDWITAEQREKGTWNTVFMISACLFIFGAIFYGIFSSGELQSWADSRRNKNKNTVEVIEQNSLRNCTNGV